MGAFNNLKNYITFTLYQTLIASNLKAETFQFVHALLKKPLPN